MAIKKIKIKKSPEWTEKLNPDSTSGISKKDQELAMIKDALDFIRAGETSWTKIGSMLHPPVSGDKIKRLVSASLKEDYQEMSDIQREMMWSDLQELKRAWWHLAVGYVDENGTEHKPEHKWAMLILKHIEKVIGMFGLNAPVEIKHTHITEHVLDVVKSSVTYDKYLEICSKLSETGSSETTGAGAIGSSGSSSGGFSN